MPSSNKQIAMTAEDQEKPIHCLSLEAMLATCDESLDGLRDRAILLISSQVSDHFRSQVFAAYVEHLTKIGDGHYWLRFSSRSDQSMAGYWPRESGTRIHDKAAVALGRWLSASRIAEGPLFRRVWKTRIGPALSPSGISKVMHKRKVLAKCYQDLDWAES